MQSVRTTAVVVLALALAAPACKAKRDSEALPLGAVTATTATAPTTVLSAPVPKIGAVDPEVKLTPLSFAPIAKKADPSVVTIYTAGAESQGFGRRGGQGQQGMGSGFIVQTDGVIITNNHVIEGADRILVQLSDERRFQGKVAGRDPRTDIAVVKIEGAKDLTAIPLGDSDTLEVGDWVVAIGNPFGLSHTVSAGIVSGKGRGREDVPLDPSGYYNFLQTDASINPGNSGGPLLNLKGEVVGMNTAIRGGGAQGIGFAIPINMVKQLMPPLLRDGKMTRSAMGVRIVDVREVPPNERTNYKIEGERGAFIAMVEPGGPADRAKLQVGDVVVGFDGQTVERGTLLQWLASTAGVGKNVTVRVTRSGKTFDLPITLGELKEAPTRRPTLRRQPIPDDELER